MGIVLRRLLLRLGTDQNLPPRPTGSEAAGRTAVKPRRGKSRVGMRSIVPPAGSGTSATSIAAAASAGA